MDEYMAEDRHLWHLGVDERLLTVQILFIYKNNKLFLLSPVQRKHHIESK